MKFARLVFLVAGIYGIAALAPQYFLERKVGEDNPAGLTHPEFFYGFLGVGIAWQIAFLMIAQDPRRYRPIFIPSVVEKFSFAAATIVLFFQERVGATMLVAAGIDLVLGALFIIAWRRLRATAIT